MKRNICFIVVVFTLFMSGLFNGVKGYATDESIEGIESTEMINDTKMTESDNIQESNNREYSPKTLLSKKIYSLRKLDFDKYTTESWSAFQKVLFDSEKIFYNKESGNNEFTTQLRALEKAEMSLEQRTIITEFYENAKKPVIWIFVILFFLILEIVKNIICLIIKRTRKHKS